MTQIDFTKISPDKLCEKLGLADEYKALKDTNWDLHLYMSSIALVLPDGKPSEAFTVKIATPHLIALTNDSADLSVVELVKHKVKGLINTDISDPVDAKSPALKATYKGTHKGTEIPADIWSKPKVPLINAVDMYQPVNGSDASSRYFLVGRTENFKFGARIKNANLSLRIESHMIGGVKKRLQDLGLATISPETNYASIHVEIKDTVEAHKVFGSIALSLGEGLLTVPPDFALLEGKGT